MPQQPPPRPQRGAGRRKAMQPNPSCTSHCHINQASGQASFYFFFSSFLFFFSLLYLWVPRRGVWQCVMQCLATLIPLFYRQWEAVCGSRTQCLLTHLLPTSGALHTQTPLWDAGPSRSGTCAPPHCPTVGKSVVSLTPFAWSVEAWLALPRPSCWLILTIRIGYAIVRPASPQVQGHSVHLSAG